MPAGHKDSSTHGVLEFSKYSSRPGTAAAGVEGAGGGGGLFAGPGSAAADWPGLWGWSAAADGCASQTGRFTSVFATDTLAVQQEAVQIQAAQAVQQVNAVHCKQRPSSRDALAFMRRQCLTDLAADACPDSALWDSAAEAAGAGILVDAIPQQRQQHFTRRQQHMPSSACQRHRPTAAGGRPASAGAVLVSVAAAAGTESLHITPGSFRGCAAARSFTRQAASSSAAVRPSSNSRTKPVTSNAAEPGDRRVYSSTGFAARIKGGTWSTSTRAAASKVLRAMSVGSVIPPASVAVLQPGTELSYDPNPEALGHIHRSPGWKLPANRTAASSKWGQLAAKAGLQQQ